MYQGEENLEELLDCATIALYDAKQELKALREQVMQEFDDGQDTIDEALVGDLTGTACLCA